jgi:hypothetical protein
VVPTATLIRRLRDRLAPLADDHGRWTAPTQLSIGFFPAFETGAQARDALWRAAWALAPLWHRVQRLGLAGISDPAVLLTARPDYFAPALTSLVGDLAPRLRTIREADILSSDLVLVWRMDAAMDGRLARTRVSLVDDVAFEHAPDRWARISSEALPSPLSASLARLEAFDRAPRFRRAVIVGTGPSLDAGIDAGLIRPDDDVYVCNSAVRRPDLFNRFNIRAIGLGDPVFHSGPCRMAGRLRTDLIDRMREHPETVLICPERDAALYAATPGLPAERMIAIGIDAAAAIETADLRRDAIVPASANVMTLTLLPMVMGRYAEIAFIGCDGQAPAQKDYFWRHSTTAQYSDAFDSAYLAHPAFFRRNFEAYANRHAETLGAWISRAEREGTKVTSLTQSHILALSERAGR